MLQCCVNCKNCVDLSWHIFINQLRYLRLKCFTWFVCIQLFCNIRIIWWAICYMKNNLFRCHFIFKSLLILSLIVLTALNYGIHIVNHPQLIHCEPHTTSHHKFPFLIYKKYWRLINWPMILINSTRIDRKQNVPLMCFYWKSPK